MTAIETIRTFAASSRDWAHTPLPFPAPLSSFAFLSAGDLAQLLERSERACYRAGETLLEEGSRRQAIFIVREGMVRVERAHLGRGVAVARLGPGVSFGEMSFLESAPASATVVAESDTHVDVIEGVRVQSLLASVPGFSSRLFQSLAVTLSQRLRDVTSLIPPLMVEEIPQVTRFHESRTGQMEARDALPPRLATAVEEFKTQMLVCDRFLKEKALGDAIAARIMAASSALEDALRSHIQQERHLEKGIGAYVFRETFSFFMQSRFCDRAYTKPRGYAGDYYTIELLYENDPRGDGRLGPYLDAWFLTEPAAQAVRHRRKTVTDVIRAELARWDEPSPMPVTSLASGPARELFDLLADGAVPLHAMCTDIDHEALSYTSRLARERGFESQMSFAQDNVLRLAKGRGRTSLPPQRLIYSIGLADYLQDELVIGILDWIHERLMPGGLAVIGNFDVHNPTKELMDHVLEWVLIHRTADDLRRLFAASRFDSSSVSVQTDKTGVQLFASCRRE